MPTFSVLRPKNKAKTQAMNTSIFSIAGLSLIGENNSNNKYEKIYKRSEWIVSNGAHVTCSARYLT